jgi:hypothetical protein
MNEWWIASLPDEWWVVIVLLIGGNGLIWGTVYGAYKLYKKWKNTKLLSTTEKKQDA